MTQTDPDRSDTARYEIGSEVRCVDGECGVVILVVVDPVANKLAHLVVRPDEGWPRLVPVALARPDDKGVFLTCTTAEFEALEQAQETHFVPSTRGDLGYPHDHVASWPFFGLGPAGPTLGMLAPEPPTVSHAEVQDRVPAGEVRIRRGEPVNAVDGGIGRVRGLVVDPADDAVTHVLLDEGHLWGKKQVAIPISAVTGIDEAGVAVRLDKDQIKDLPPVEVTGGA